jgi:hypothetical protein
MHLANVPMDDGIFLYLSGKYLSISFSIGSISVSLRRSHGKPAHMHIYHQMLTVCHCGRSFPQAHTKAIRKREEMGCMAARSSD